MAIDAPVQIPRQRIKELIEREESQLDARTQRSKETYARAIRMASIVDSEPEFV